MGSSDEKNADAGQNAGTKMMTEDLIVRERFEAWSGKNLANETIDIFKCGFCGGIMIGIYDSQYGFYDPERPDKKFTYNRGPAKCPLCRKTWNKLPWYKFGYGQYKISDVPVDEFAFSGWHWMAKWK